MLADHNGALLKKALVNHLLDEGYNCIDVGCFDDLRSVDYAEQVALMISCCKVKYGVLICGTGIGMSIAVKKFPNVRASLVHNQLSAKKTREHNDSNVICLGTWVNDEKANIRLVDTWINEPFAEGRHVPRLKKLSMLPRELKNSIILVIAKNSENLDLINLARSLGNQVILALPELDNKYEYFNFSGSNSPQLAVEGFTSNIFEIETSSKLFEETSPDIVILEDERLLKGYNLSIPKEMKLIFFLL